MVHVVVMVLGDLGRSPRMQYHAQSLSTELTPTVHLVTQIGYAGEAVMTPPNPCCEEIRFTPWEFTAFRRIALVHAVLKGMGLLMKLFICLLRLKKYDVIIVQNPPCLPAVMAAYAMSFVNGSQIIIDWHNLGFAMFQERLGPKHLLVRMVFHLERVVASKADAHVCVSQALQSWLKENFAISATVVHDRPAKLFSRVRPSTAQRHDLLSRLEFTDEKLFPQLFGGHSQVHVGGNIQGDTVTCQTCVDSVKVSRRREEAMMTEAAATATATAAATTGAAHLPPPKEMLERPDRAKLVISSTSWTEDEDFGLLLEALEGLDRLLCDGGEIGRGSNSAGGKANDDIIFSTCLSSSSSGSSSSSSSSSSGGRSARMCSDRRVVVVVTGRGPLKAAFEEKVCSMPLTRVAVRTAWLSASDYPLLLGCADVGVCLHTSTSGLDLPMKVLDMFGSGLPVCAVAFPALPELVQHGENGLVFRTSAELRNQLAELLFGYGDGSEEGRESSSAPGSDTGLRRGTTAAGLLSAPTSTDAPLLRKLREAAGSISSWDENWRETMRPVVLAAVTRSHSSPNVVVIVIICATLLTMALLEPLVQYALKPILRAGMK